MDAQAAGRGASSMAGCRLTGGSACRILANGGICRVRLSVRNGFKCVVVDSVQDTYYISAGYSNGKVIVTDTPRLHR